jgi:UPF0271 protein
MYINCDVAESYGNFKIGDDPNIIPYVDACNIACGFHGGDPLTIWNTINLAINHQKLIGAHPSYPDLQGFGRRNMQMNERELYASMMYQIGAVKSMTEVQGGKLHHVKPHGALYNFAAVDTKTANVIAQAINDIDHSLLVLTQLGSALHTAADGLGLQVHGELFADRRYEVSGQLASRDNELGVIKSAEDIFRHYQQLVNGFALTIDGSLIPAQGNTICIHGDHPQALEALRLIKNHGNRLL